MCDIAFRTLFFLILKKFNLYLFIYSEFFFLTETTVDNISKRDDKGEILKSNLRGKLIPTALDSIGSMPNVLEYIFFKEWYLLSLCLLDSPNLFSVRCLSVC